MCHRAVAAPLGVTSIASTLEPASHFSPCHSSSTIRPVPSIAALQVKRTCASSSWLQGTYEMSAWRGMPLMKALHAQVLNGAFVDLACCRSGWEQQGGEMHLSWASGRPCEGVQGACAEEAAGHLRTWACSCA